MDSAPLIFNPLFFPFTNFLLLPPLDWETLHESFWRYFLWFLSIAFYVLTSLWAGFVAHRHRFSQYRLDVVRSVDSAVLGCFFCWLHCFPYVLINRRRVIQGKARLLSELASYERSSKGAVVDVLVWTVVWGIIMAAAIPSILPSRMRSNERQAVVTLRTYARAQEWYRAADNSGYCQDSRALLFGRAGADHRRFHISRHRIDAFAGVPEAWVNTAPSHGYVFFDDPFVAARGLWREQFGYFAFPAKPGMTGMHAYWIGKDGVVFKQETMRGAKAGDVANSGNSPLYPQRTTKWELLEK